MFENSFSTCLFQYRVPGSHNLSLHLRAQGRHPPGLDTIPSHGALTATATLRRDTVDTTLPDVHGSDRGGNQTIQRKPVQTWAEHANTTKTVAPAGNQFFFLSTL